ncbi:hypothetical protein A2274_00295 [candidate division WWE3 bacterium RIFOXYA12_FULL_43_11]|uniref:Uncharacterized protein n=2 Tax=Katanobacteria TaxID=422282 RepID=A0A0G0Y1D2_UNCKA|nr:MAG: hypothetical protein UR43_C0017G0015 [candidate division TM6 bacterium GW2011_GWF2_33_332]KKS03226.1 MAG: hypothetical protein UU55_C0004G0015 [candidate division WWE3 bacterium GW2011_GWC2_41_23]OGC59193.1 MAG: hypothetical protein A2245_00320 [candidate division WWE3 bacterium RIFOXYA2_FULL_43_12]OGC65540.1 MAG: hypothetical protein A2274_00295 [candidate division WWE3 bacterium RIFOXYA12_FULL_43_11]HBY09782.1 hypothetical protein [candidate division WWE3 bacterium]HLD90713.1 hypothe
MINKRFDLKKLKDLLNEALEEQKKVDLGKLLDERTASKAFVAITMKNASNMWPDIKAKRMAPYVRGKLVTETDEVASLDLGLVLIALGINQIGNLFPKEQAERLTQYTFDELAVDKTGYSTNEVVDYIAALSEGKDAKDGFDNVITILLNQWFGKNTDTIMFKPISGSGVLVIDPIIKDFIFEAIALAPTFWDTIKGDYKLYENS